MANNVEPNIALRELDLLNKNVPACQTLSVIGMNPNATIKKDHTMTLRKKDVLAWRRVNGERFTTSIMVWGQPANFHHMIPLVAHMN